MVRWTEKLIALLLILFMLAYVSYQLFIYFYSPLKTETAFQYSFMQKISSQGIAIRSETVIAEPMTGVKSNIFEDGTRVAVNQQVVEYYSSDSGDNNRSRVRQIELELKNLEEAENPMVSNYSNADSINREIKDKLSVITKMSDSEKYQSLNDIRLETTFLLNKKQIALGKEENYSQRIAQLNSEYDQILTRDKSNIVSSVSAPVSGYFVSNVDGFEETISVENIDNLTVSDYKIIIDNSQNVANSYTTGKIVTSPKWYFIISSPKYDVQWMKEGQPVFIEFDTIEKPVPAVVQKVVSNNKDDQSIVIFSSKYIDRDILNLRIENAIVHIEQYSGIRISDKAVRFQDDLCGVYTLYNNTVYFKEINIVYEEPGFVISKISDESNEKNELKVFDQIIVDGMDLYDGKVIE